MISPHDPEHGLRGRQRAVPLDATRARAGRSISPDLTRNDPAKLVPRAARSRRTTPASSTTARSSRSRSRRSRRACSGPAPTTASCTSRATTARPGRTSRPRRSREWSTVSQIDVAPHDAGHGVRRGQPLQARRLPAVRLRHARLRPDLALDRGRPARRRRLRARRCARTRCGQACSSAAPRPASTSRFDDGAHWRPLRVNRPGLIADLDRPDGEARGALPLVPITDLVVKDASLVVATQGRAFWILDDLAPLRQMTPAGGGGRAPVHALARLSLWRARGRARQRGPEPALRRAIFYRLAQEPREKEEITLEILDPRASSCASSRTEGRGAEDAAARRRGRRPAGPAAPRRRCPPRRASTASPGTCAIPRRRSSTA